ncbi:MAG: metallophosphoesterase [Chitinophagaceae bacterium]|nr:metallophosphoesterase [Chitinophagaceae bacterium]
MKFIQITDSHLLEGINVKLHNMPINEIHNKIISEVKKLNTEIEFVLITGDISDNGSEESYHNAKEIFSSLNKPTYWIAGNHDNLEAIHLFNNQTNIKSDKSFTSNGIHFILLNSVALSPDGKNRNRGVLSSKELAFLKLELKQNPTKQIVVALHHPPIKSGTWKDDRMLENAEEFLEVIKQYSNIKLVLYGHQHQVNETTIGETKFYSPPAASFQFDKNIKWGFDDLPPGFGVISIINDNTFECHSIYIDFQTNPIYNKSLY